MERTDTDRRIAASGRRGPFGARAAKRLLADAAGGDAGARDAVVRIARNPAHRLHERARERIAGWWARTRDPELRQAVLDTGAIAVREPARLQTLALHGRLLRWLPEEAGRAPELLADPDPDVRAHAAAFCRTATGAMLHALWDADTGPGTPLRDVLLAGMAPPPAAKLAALWDAWFEAPSEELGDALLRWSRPSDDARCVVALETDATILRRTPYREALLDAVGMRGHPLRDIAREKFGAVHDRPLIEELCERAVGHEGLAGFCAQYRFAPADPVTRAAFYLLTGQPNQYRALDPDGGLLSLAYLSRGDADRARLREAMLVAGELDLVRVVVGDDRRARVRDMSADEVRYLAEQLAHRGEWDDLWALVLDVPIPTGAALFRLFEGWAPRGEDDRELFTRFRRADRAAVAAGLRDGDGDRARWTAARRGRLRFRHHVDDVSFAPDGPFLAVAGRAGVAGVFDLRTARLVERYDWFDSPVGCVLHAGNGVVLAGERGRGGAGPCRVVRCADGSDTTLHTGLGSVTSLALTGDGTFAGGTRDGDLLLGDAGGPVRVRPITEFGLGLRQWPRRIVAHRGSGRLALLGRSVHLIDPATGHAVGAHPGRPVTEVGFVDADTVACADAKGWTVQLRVADGHRVPARHAQIRGCAGLGTLPRTGQVVIADRTGDLHFLSGATLSPLDVHRSPSGARPTGLTVSPGGEFLAAGNGDGRIDLFDLRPREVPALVRRPVADLVPRDLGAVDAALANPLVTGRDRAVLELLGASLAHRFRFDVELGETVELAAGEHDISL
ncbi:hypothetical protein [Actinomadura sp. WMMB 499]|uniref:hypothetical protein n=1 Tax=Actinomadura sp. WMMB 499 TaxID=1219491 RepID=UPI0012487CE2|nr:hypothetical protein [Actinomadura sp. WMMB 499]QFG21480.1 hypothetical protein F7P10_10400 [Actinomadura sp. WMMB 499]